MLITNTRIEKQRAEINKIKAKIAGMQHRLRVQEKQLRDLEDLEIVAQFRKERLSDEHLDTLRSSASMPTNPTDIEMPDKTIEEDTRNAISAE